MRSSAGASLSLLALASSALAKTDLAGCTSSSTVVNGGASMVYWVPGTGELCELLDCGGGRAPPKTTVPGCPQYSGTASYQPNYLPGYGPNSQPAVTTPAPAVTSVSGSFSEILPTLSAYPTDYSDLLAYDTSSTKIASSVVPTSSVDALASSVATPALSTIITKGPTGIQTLVVSPTTTGPFGNLTVATTTRTPTALSTGAAPAMVSAGKEMIGLALGVVAGLAML